MRILVQRVPSFRARDGRGDADVLHRKRMKDAVQVTVRALMPTPQGVGVFLTDGRKTIAIFIDPMVASALSMTAAGVKAPRPLTHDLIARILEGFGARVQKVVINDLQGETFYARLYLIQEGELGRHLLEVDARPSDSLVLAQQQGCPILVGREVWDQVGDMTWALEAAEAAARNEANKKPEPPDPGLGGTEGNQ
jgi:hypothetical protein